METSSTRPILTIEKHRQVTLVGLRRPNLKNNPNGNPLLGLDPGECAPLEQPDSHPGLPHVTPEEPETIRLASTTLWMNQNTPTTKVVGWKEFTQTNLKEIDPKLNDS